MTVFTVFWIAVFIAWLAFTAYVVLRDDSKDFGL